MVNADKTRRTTSAIAGPSHCRGIGGDGATGLLQSNWVLLTVGGEFVGLALVARLVVAGRLIAVGHVLIILRVERALRCGQACKQGVGEGAVTTYGRAWRNEACRKHTKESAIDLGGAATLGAAASVGRRSVHA